MAEVKYNVYYSLSSAGPWTKANASPITRVEAGNSFTITDLTPGGLYYIAVIGGVEASGTFFELISQPIGPEEGTALRLDDVDVSPLAVRMLSLDAG